jgi:hypothetical protein
MHSGDELSVFVKFFEDTTVQLASTSLLPRLR